ncbi:hypothetical protein MNBD_NITROSPINAE02-1436 [hydrothermal vent metagenome]|uniref:HD/PDEase domain-containing protein n=1 Tax=hydrothermal vent metagenome TaxID=652676 RepID=A0A3B1CMN6_9ZZZZ
MNADQKIKTAIKSLPPCFTDAINHFHNLGFKTWLVGGAVRDALMGKEMLDLDLVFDRNPVAAASQYARDSGLGFATLDEERKIARIVGKEPGYYTIDVALMQGDSIEEDLGRRDFTLNAIALFWMGDDINVTDPHGGIDDIGDNILRPVFRETFIKDPVRILRIYRFALTHGLVIAPETQRLTAYAQKLLPDCPGERIANELYHILKSPESYRAFLQMSKDGVLDYIFPEMTGMRGVTQNHWHHLDVFDHSMETLLKLEETLSQPPPWLSPFAAKIFATLDEKISFGITRGMALKLAALYHDTGKPGHRAEDPSGKVTFIEHEKLSEKFTGKLAKRLRLPGAVTSGLSAIVLNHLRPLNAISEGKISPKACYRYNRDLGEWAVPASILCYADALATRGPRVTDERRRQEEMAIIDLLQFIEHEEAKPAGGRLPVTGKDMMEKFNIPEGPLIGQLLETLREAVSMGDVSSEGEAYRFIDKILEERGGLNR